MSIGKNKISIASTSSSVESPVPSLGYHHNVHGMSWIITGLFVVGDLAGGGIVALPTATVQLGENHFDVYFGLFLTFVMTLCVAYTAYILGEAWVILQRKWPIYRSHCRKPYPEMAGRSMGRIMKLVPICDFPK
ncbi:unnamed protein product [Anisakis simplex]|uniref:Aa_trans domain-containing protein n=1 Tax=Anisakis simplex TaxID=6269 RepID=A0A0M3KFW7_ANISI|nr:unnamed protein product [Anisakis simplex]